MAALLWHAYPGTCVVTPRSAYALVRAHSRTRDHFRMLAAVNLILLPLAVVTFGDRFHFWSLPLSDLGMPRTVTDNPNYVSFSLFAVTMAASSATMLRFAAVCTQTPAMPYRRAKALLSVLAAAGFLVGIFPHDRFHFLHLTGCASMVGALWFLGNLFSRELHAAGRGGSALAVQLILQATVLPYAAGYFAGAEPRQALQKIAFAGLIVALTLATRTLRQAALQAAMEQSRWTRVTLSAADHPEAQMTAQRVAVDQAFRLQPGVHRLWRPLASAGRPRYSSRGRNA